MSVNTNLLIEFLTILSITGLLSAILNTFFGLLEVKLWDFFDFFFTILKIDLFLTLSEIYGISYSIVQKN